jgi:hypothetical protein
MFYGVYHIMFDGAYPHAAVPLLRGVAVCIEGHGEFYAPLDRLFAELPQK